MRKTVFILVIALAVLSPLVAAELVARWIGLGDPIVYSTNAAYRYAPVPNQHVDRRGASVTIGAEGLRGLEPWSGPADHHVLFVGDSVTWGGTNTDDDKTFAYLTCAELEARLARNFVCGNAGVNGYGTDNMIARLRYDPELERADTVVVTLISVDPIRGTSDLASAHFSRAGPSARSAASGRSRPLAPSRSLPGCAGSPSPTIPASTFLWLRRRCSGSMPNCAGCSRLENRS